MEKQWIETGLMFFSTDYLRRSDFIKRYDWPNRKVIPTPERLIRLFILQKDLNNKQLSRHAVEGVARRQKSDHY